ncbi:Phosphoglycolate phosphatase [subsurface metagenome]
MIKAVFFDFYNTLVDYDPPREETQSRVLGELGVKVNPEALRRPIMVADDFLSQEHARLSLGKRPKEETMALYGQYQGIILREAGLEASPELIGNILKKWMSADLKMALYDDVAPTLTHLRELGLTLGLISNVDRDITSVYEELGLANWLQVTVTSQDVGFNKPRPEIFQAALKQAGVKPAEAIYVGDQYQIDVVGANGAGMRGILIDRNGFFEDVTDSPRIRSLAEVAQHLG